MTDFICEQLGKQHDRKRFRCGVDELDEWLRERARQDQKRRVSAVFVLVPATEPGRIAGFYTLSAASVVLTALPSQIANKLPRYPVVPAVLIGRLARDVEFSGVGEKLLFDALRRAWLHSADIAAAVILVDAKNERAREFYCRFGFEPLPDAPNRLFLPMKTVEALA